MQVARNYQARINKEISLDRQQTILTPKSIDVDIIPALWGDIPLDVNFYYEDLPQGSFLSLPRESEKIFAREEQYFVSFEEIYLEERKNNRDFSLLLEDLINNTDHFGPSMLLEMMKMRFITTYALHVGGILIVIT